MPFIPVPNTHQMAIQGHVGVTPWQSNLNIRWPSAVTLTQVVADAYRDAIEAAFDTANFEANLDLAWQADRLVTTDLTSPTAPQFTSVFADLIGEASGAGVLPLQVNFMIEWTTAMRGRSFRGRTFINGLSGSAGETQPNAGLINSGNALAAALITNFAAIGTGTGLAVVSRFSGTHINTSGKGKLRTLPTPRATGIATLITAGASETVYKTQRRRALAG